MLLQEYLLGNTSKHEQKAVKNLQCCYVIIILSCQRREQTKSQRSIILLSKNRKILGNWLFDTWKGEVDIATVIEKRKNLNSKFKRKARFKPAQVF